MNMSTRNWVIPSTLFTLAFIAIILLALSLRGETEELEKLVEPVAPTPPPVIIEVDGVNCVIAEVPVLTYYVASDSVRVTIECDPDILWHYLPAVITQEINQEINQMVKASK